MQRVTAIPGKTVPEAGQLVSVRQRRYVVREVKPSALPPLQLLGSSPPGPPEHLFYFQSIDDGLGEELAVVWELEPGTQLFERTHLPDPSGGFDEPARLDAFLDAVRWGAVASADVRSMHAPFRAGITVEDYQLDPVARAVDMPRVSLLIADDVGLGKTIEAGLVLQELILRHRGRTALVVCPAGLQLQWRDQMRDKFGLEFREHDHVIQWKLGACGREHRWTGLSIIIREQNSQGPSESVNFPEARTAGGGGTLRQRSVHDGPPRPRTAPRDRWAGIHATTVLSRGAGPSSFVNKGPSNHVATLIPHHRQRGAA